MEIVADTEDWFMESWLDRNYGGGPDECPHCFRNGKIVKLVNCVEHQ